MSLADQIIGSALESSQSKPTSAQDSLNSILSLGQGLQQLQVNRQRLEQQKQELAENKMNRFLNTINTGLTKIPKGAQGAFFDKVVRSQADQLGIPLTDTFLDVLKKDEESRTAFAAGLSEMLNAGGFKNLDDETKAKVVQGLSDPERLPELMDLTKGLISQQAQADRFAASLGIRREGQEREDLNKERTRLMQVKNSFNSRIKAFKDRLGAADNALALLNSNKPISDEAVKTQIARLSGEVGALTDQDVARFGGAKDLLSRGKQLVETLSTGKLTPENKKQLVQITRELRSVVANKIKAEAQTDVESAQDLGLNPSQVQKVLGAERIVQPMQSKVPQDESKLLEAGVSRAIQAGLSDEQIAAQIKTKRPQMSDSDIKAMIKKARGGK